MQCVNPEWVLLKDPAETEKLASEVAVLGDSHRVSFGFLPAASYEEAAARGRLWIAINARGEILGYLFFGGRYPNARITQLFVHEQARSTGLGRYLVEALKEHAAETGIQTISARVAADLPANLFWSKCGFKLVSQVPGGQQGNRVINLRLFEVPDACLWNAGDVPPVETGDVLLRARAPALIPSYVLDLNILFDVINDRPDLQFAKQILAAAMSAQLQLKVTAEFARELERHSAGTDVDPVLKLARALPSLPQVPDSVLGPTVAALRALIFPEQNRSKKRASNDNSDLVHLASCIHHKAAAFLTREKAILRRASELQDRFGLEVLSPADVLQQEPAKTSFGLSAVVGRATLNLVELSEHHRAKAEAFLKRFLRGAATERILDPGSSSAPRQRWFGADENGEFVGVLTYSVAGVVERSIRAFLITASGLPVQQAFVDHALQVIAGQQSSSQFSLIELAIYEPDEQALSTLKARGYSHDGQFEEPGFIRFRRIGYKGVVRLADWSAFRSQLKKATDAELPARPPTFVEAKHSGLLLRLPESHGVAQRSLASFEVAYGPLVLLLSGRPAAIVPIWESHAVELLSLERRQLDLLPGTEAQLHIERAYFGKVGFERSFARDGIVIFYVSGTRGGRKAAVGLARITYAAKIPEVKARTEFGRYGVLDSQIIEEMASASGEIGVFGFDSVHLFRTEISYERLRSMGCIGGANLVTVQKLTESQLERIVEAGFGS
jgi:GNAT superfamily N-acetyltransferase/predicted nucleic acid-binding protein